MFIYTQPKTTSDIKSNGDCMVRAVTLATGVNYSVVHKIMYKHGWRASRRNEKTKWDYQIEKTLSELGFSYRKESFPAVKGQKRMTPETLSNTEYEAVYICQVAKHLVCVRYGNVLDTWDSSNKCVYTAWKVWKD